MSDLVLDASRSRVRIQTFAEGFLARLAHDLELSCSDLSGTASAVTSDGHTAGAAHVEAPLRGMAIAGEAHAGARLCGINLLAQLNAALDGDLDRVVRVVKLGGFVQAGPGFTAIPAVINGCSDLMVEVFGDAGRHARSAVGVYQLPLGFAVEVDAIVEVR